MPSEYWINNRRETAEGRAYLMSITPMENYPPVYINPLVMLVFKAMGIRGHYELGRVIADILHDPVECTRTILMDGIRTYFDMFTKCSRFCTENERWQDYFLVMAASCSREAIVNVMDDDTDSDEDADVGKYPAKHSRVKLLAHDGGGNTIVIENANYWRVYYRCDMDEEDTGDWIIINWDHFDYFDLCRPVRMSATHAQPLGERAAL